VGRAAQKLIRLFDQFERTSLGKRLIVADVTGDGEPDVGKLMRIVGAWEAAEPQPCGRQDVFQSHIWLRVVEELHGSTLPEPGARSHRGRGAAHSIRTGLPDKGAGILERRASDGATIRRVALTRAPGTCAEPGCAGVPIAKGRCRQHLVWPKRNPDRADGRTIRRLRDRLARRDGYRCRHPDASPATCTRGEFPLEVHHLNGDVTDNRLEVLELRCRRHNPRGPATHKR
jgi:hypothetical protein